MTSCRTPLERLAVPRLAVAVVALGWAAAVAHADPTPLAAGVDEAPASGAAPASAPAVPAPAPAAPTARLGAPSPQALEEAEKLVKQVYKDEYAAKTPADRRNFALKLLQHGLATNDDVASRYVLLREARDVAASAGDAVTAFQAIDQMSRDFNVKSLPVKLGVLDQSAKAATTPEGHAAVVQAGLGVLDEVLAVNDFDAADEIVPAVESAARKGLTGAEQAAALARTREVRAQRAEYATVKPALDKLATAPDDAEANLAAGRFFALQRGDWSRGLAYLAKGSDAALKAAAAADLANPADPSAQAQVADRWEKVADQQTAKAKAACQARALEWYEKALPTATGLRKTAIEIKVQALREVVVPARPAAATPTAAAASPAGPSGPAPVAAATPAPARPLESRPLSTELVRWFALSPDGRLAVTTSGGDLIIYDVATGRDVRRIVFPGRRTRTEDVAYTPDGRRLSMLFHNRTGAPNPANPDGLAVSLYDLPTGNFLVQFVPPGDRPVAVGSDGRRVVGVTRPDHQTLVFWDAATQREIARFNDPKEPYIRAVTLAPDLRRAYVGSNFGPISIVDLANGQTVAQLAEVKGWCPVILVSPDSKSLLAGAENGALYAWDLATRQLLWQTAPAGNLTALGRSADGRRVVAAYANLNVCVYDGATGALLHTLTVPQRIQRLEVTPDGRTMVFLWGGDTERFRIAALPR